MMNHNLIYVFLVDKRKEKKGEPINVIFGSKRYNTHYLNQKQKQLIFFYESRI